MWLVDFFAPWCPPCQKLLPEVRKASRALATDPHVRVATVDCTVQMQVCQRAQVESKGLQFSTFYRHVQVNSYPTTIVYNNTQPHSFVGLHSMAVRG